MAATDPAIADRISRRVKNQSMPLAGNADSK